MLDMCRPTEINNPMFNRVEHRALCRTLKFLYQIWQTMSLYSSVYTQILMLKFGSLGFSEIVNASLSGNGNECKLVSTFSSYVVLWKLMSELGYTDVGSFYNICDSISFCETDIS